MCPCRWLWLVALLAASVGFFARDGNAAEGCPQGDSELVADRPDVTNSSLVVPTGSLQSENGVDLSRRYGSTFVDGTNSRLRLGIAPCLEFLVDLPSFTTPTGGQGVSGWSNLSPAVKWQLGPLPGGIDLSATAGVGLPTGTAALTGAGVQPYVQFPWSRDFADGWGISGMFTAFFFPGEPDHTVTHQATFSVSKKLNASTEAFAEFVSDYGARIAPSHLINTGALYHLTPLQQIDFHFAFGLNRSAPAYSFGIGYSFRIDGLF